MPWGAFPAMTELAFEFRIFQEKENLCLCRVYNLEPEFCESSVLLVLARRGTNPLRLTIHPLTNQEIIEFLQNKQNAPLRG
jgi:hypothetical protein